MSKDREDQHPISEKTSDADVVDVFCVLVWVIIVFIMVAWCWNSGR